MRDKMLEMQGFSNLEESESIGTFSNTMSIYDKT